MDLILTTKYIQRHFADVIDYILWNLSLCNIVRNQDMVIDVFSKLLMCFYQGSSERLLGIEVWMMRLGDVLFTYSIKEGGGQNGKMNI